MDRSRFLDSIYLVATVTCQGWEYPQIHRLVTEEGLVGAIGKAGYDGR